MLHAVIMAGGSGTRFWPASRRTRPKQFLTLVAESPLLRITYERLVGLVPPERTWVVTTSATADATRGILPELPAENILAEPVGRNTAACAGFAAHALLAKDPEATCVVLPADHLIGEELRFRSAVTAGAEFVGREGGLLTFGVQPTRPETGYGYLVLEQLREHLPDLATGLDRIAAALGTADADAVIADVYPDLPATSVDFGVMEKATRCWTMPVDFPWSDVGSWSALAETLVADSSENRMRGRIHSEGAHGNILVSTGPTLSVVGVDDLVVVATPDAVLVMPKDEAQKVKDVVEALRERGWDDVL